MAADPRILGLFEEMLDGEDAERGMPQLPRTALDHLRQRDNFQKLVAELEGKVK